MKNLVIVESPNKIKSIEKYLGDDFKVLASVGHIVYLPSSGEHRFGVDLKTWTPNYKIDPDKQKVVNELKKAAQDSEIIFVATDPDREGEAIADNLVHFLNIENKYKRIRFNEITQNAVKQAIENPDTINELLVKSQIARRILDRIIGYKLSSLMKSKIASSPNTPSAGRVQSIALKLVTEREKEIEAFVPVQYFTIDGSIVGFNDVIVNYYNPNNKDNKEWAKLEEIDNLKKFLTKKLKIVNIEVSEKRETKLTPLKQSALYKKADSSLGLSASNVQRAAQRLYEGYGDGGLISYPRTDSTRLSDVFVNSAKDYIISQFGINYFATEIKGTSGTQDAHEAIRPTDLSLTPSEAINKFNISGAEAKIYELIWTHTMQVLMKVPIRQITRYELKDGDYDFRMSSSKIIFDGYYKVTNYENKKELPIFNLNQELSVEQYNFNEHFTQPPARYNDGSLIEKLDEIGVGRPSTFATTVNILKEREYVSQEGRALKPTEFGKVVIEKLLEAFPKIINEQYTANMETQLDEVADGKYKYQNILDEFWNIFQQDLQSATIELSVTKMLPIYANKKCPLCGSELLIRRNKKDGSKFFGCSKFPECKYIESDPNAKPKFRKIWKKKTSS